MRATFFGLEIARSALFVSQKQLDVTGHNIANVDTPGYSRQRIDVSAVDPLSGMTFLKNMENGRVGGGVDALSTSQIRDVYLDWQYRVQASTTGQWDSRFEGMYRIESMFDETGETKFQTVISSFYLAVNQVSSNTEDNGVRGALVGATNSLTNYFQLKYAGFQSQLEYEDKAIKSKAESINSIAESIALLNEKIYNYEFMTSEKANDLRDKRNLLVDKLSKLVDIDYGEESPNGDPQNLNFWITIGGDSSHRLVDHTFIDTIKVDKGAMNQYAAMEIDRLTGKIAAYNDAIDNNPANTDAMLQRTKATKELAAYIKQLGGAVQITYDGTNIPIDQIEAMLNDESALSGNLVISLAQDPSDPATTYENMVNRGASVQLKDMAQADKANIGNLRGAFDMNQITWGDNTQVSIRNGEIYGHLIMRDGGDSANNGIPYYMYKLNEYVRTLAGEFNAIHEQGYTMPYSENLTQYESVNGVSFFTSKDGGPITAGSVILNEIINKDASNIALSSVKIDPSQPSTETDNVEIGKELYRMLDRATSGDKTLFSGLWGEFIADITKDAEYAVNTITVNERVSDALQNRRLSVMGVSIEEEMTNLIRFNHAYSAASRLVTVLDEALDKLINGTGRVGL